VNVFSFQKEKILVGEKKSYVGVYTGSLTLLQTGVMVEVEIFCMYN
jgi:hypothetical protein